jgi:hypothetical protein
MALQITRVDVYVADVGGAQSVRCEYSYGPTEYVDVISNGVLEDAEISGITTTSTLAELRTACENAIKVKHNIP